MMEQIQAFLSYPQLPDLIAYILIIVAYIVQIFVKKFVKRDNQKTSFSIDAKVNKLKNLEKELEEQKERSVIERKAMEESRLSLEKEMETLKQTIRLSANNTKELVASGIANKIDKMLPLNDESCMSDLRLDENMTEEENKND